MLYPAITQYLGFKKYGDEYKVMGLAPYGKPAHADAISRLVRLDAGGGFRLDLDYFRHWTGAVTMSWESGEPVVADVYTNRLIELLRSGAPSGSSRSTPSTRTSPHRCSGVFEDRRLSRAARGARAHRLTPSALRAAAP